MNSLLLQTGITLQSNLPLKYLIKRLTFWIKLFTKARDFTTKESLTSIRISLSATLTGSEKVSYRANPLDFLELTPQLNPSMRTSTTSKNAFALKVTLTIS